MSSFTYIDCTVSGEDFICDRQSVTVGNPTKLRFRFSSDWASLSRYVNFRTSKNGTDKTGQLTIMSSEEDITSLFDGADFLEFGFIGKDKDGNVARATNIRCILLKDGAYIVNPGATAENLTLIGRFSTVEGVANQAMSIAEQAKEVAEGANTTSENANTNAEEAKKTALRANSLSERANDVAAEAKNIAESANVASLRANTTASEAKRTAQSADTKAGGAVTTAMNARIAADNANAVSEEAKIIADGIEKRANNGEFKGDKGDAFKYSDFTEKEKEDLLKDTYTQDEADVLLDAFSVVTRKRMSLTGDKLEGKKDSDHIHLMSVTNNNAIIFDEAYEHTGRYFGYVGVKNVTEGEYLLYAEIKIATDFDMSKARVQGYYQQTVGGSSLPEGVVVGIPQRSTNFILYPFTGSSDKAVKGFYFDAQGTNAPTVKLTLKDVRLYKLSTVTKLKTALTAKPLKHKIFDEGNTVTSYSIGSCVLLRRNGIVYASSLSDAKDEDIVLYKPLDEVFANKEDTKASLDALGSRVTNAESGLGKKADATALTVLENVVNAKGLVFMQYAAGTKIPLEKDCLYYIRCNNDTVYYYKNGEKLSQYTSGFGDGLVMMTSNIYQGAHVNFFAAPSMGSGLFGSAASMNGYTITTLDTDEVYTMSESDAVNVWKLKA